MRFCLYVCSIDKRGCYYNGPSIRGSELINFFVEHKKIQPFVKFICLPLLYQFIHLLKSFLYLFYYYFIDTTLCSTLLQSFYLILLKPSPCLFVIIFFMYVMTALSDRYYVLTIFIPIKGFFKWGLYDAKIPPPLFCL